MKEQGSLCEAIRPTYGQIRRFTRLHRSKTIQPGENFPALGGTGKAVTPG
ncbi:hypothetical protein [Pandoraea terrigena]|uniref:Uncharacterized protein n=1 Tax=Pandoraea terrigena TaxID=2508292 RepID=A0A5E4UUY2_9BURK|nr:hypothetical protein [Pandoraea terrigena]VVE03284.1 hypothetical protein PTE31013_02254 [Pandoraea terrigena]